MFLYVSENPTLVQSKQGQVKLTIEYVKGTLHVMVMHAKDLVGLTLSFLCVAFFITTDEQFQ